jgi:hypothetical protein
MGLVDKWWVVALLAVNLRKLAAHILLFDAAQMLHLVLDQTNVLELVGNLSAAKILIWVFFVVTLRCPF